MTEQEAAGLFVVLGAAYPAREMPENTMDVWWDSLHAIDAQVALEAARNVVKAEEWFPTLAKFLEYVNAEKRRRAVDASQVRGLPSSTIEKDWKALGRVRLAEVREVLETARRKTA